MTAKQTATNKPKPLRQKDLERPKQRPSPEKPKPEGTEDMNRAALERLNRLLEDKWREVYDARSHLRVSIQAITAHSAWKDTCRSLEVWGFRCREDFDFAYPGQIFEETVVVLDPDPNGRFLEMTHETADKMLTLGLP